MGLSSVFKRLAGLSLLLATLANCATDLSFTKDEENIVGKKTIQEITKKPLSESQAVLLTRAQIWITRAEEALKKNDVDYATICLRHVDETLAQADLDYSFVKETMAALGGIQEDVAK